MGNGILSFLSAQLYMPPLPQKLAAQNTTRPLSMRYLMSKLPTITEERSSGPHALSSWVDTADDELVLQDFESGKQSVRVSCYNGITSDKVCTREGCPILPPSTHSGQQKFLMVDGSLSCIIPTVYAPGDDRIAAEHRISCLATSAMERAVAHSDLCVVVEHALLCYHKLTQ